MNDVSRQIREILLELSVEQRVGVLELTAICLRCGDDCLDDVVGIRECWCGSASDE